MRWERHGHRDATETAHFATIDAAVDIAAVDIPGVTSAEVGSIIEDICGSKPAKTLAAVVDHLGLDDPADIRNLLEGAGAGAAKRCPDVAADAPGSIADTYAATTRPSCSHRPQPPPNRPPQQLRPRPQPSRRLRPHRRLKRHLRRLLGRPHPRHPLRRHPLRRHPPAPTTPTAGRPGRRSDTGSTLATLATDQDSTGTATASRANSGLSPRPDDRRLRPPSSRSTRGRNQVPSGPNDLAPLADPPSTTTTVTPEPGPPPPSTTARAGPTSPEPAVELPLGLVVAPERNADTYDRKLFRHWIDADRDGCNTRCEVLQAERRSDLPGLASGWESMYDGYTTDDSDELEIDHVVALAEAWRSGADEWDAAWREAFANDLDEPDVLVAVTAATNRSKSDRDPAKWQPPNRSSWCRWANAVVTVKRRWALSVDQAEATALEYVLALC